jgi:predicted metal-dependent enzyme (double-stranded beta helix superfamily)
MTDALAGGGLAAVSRWFAARLTEDRDLTPDELRQVADELAARPDLWRALVRHDADERIYVRLHRDHHLDVWLICWMGSQETGLHDHDVSSGAVRVVDGRLGEDRLVLGRAGFDTVEYAPGEGFSFDASRIHDVRHTGAEPSVSLHVYSPPLWRMGYYETGADGLLARRSASYAEELQAS